MNKRKIFQIIILLGLFVLFGIYFLQNFNEFRQLKIINQIYLIPIFILILLFLTTNGIVLKYFLEPFKIKLKFKEWFGLSIITTMGNYLTPFRGGAISRAAYLKKKHKFSYTYFLSSLAGIYVIVFLINSFIGILTMLILWLYLGLFNLLLTLIFSIIFLVLLAIITFSPKLKKTKYKIINKIIEVINGWHKIKSNKKVLLIITLASFINIIIMILVMFLEFKVFGIDVTLLDTLLLSIVSTLTLFVSITPGSIGIKEALVAATATIISISTTHALVISILDRFINIVIVLMLGPVFSYLLLKKPT